MCNRKALQCWAFAIGVMSFIIHGTALAEGFYISPSLGVYHIDHQYGLDDESTGVGSLGVELGLSPNFGLEFSGMTNFNGDEVDINQARVDGLWYLKDDSSFIRPYLIGGLGYTGTDFTDALIEDNESAFVDAGLGVKLKLTDEVAIRSDIRHIHTLNESGQDLAVTVGFAFKFGNKKVPVAPPVVITEPSDRDNDGVIDSLDQCPLTPAVASVDERGCPLDSDKDGVFDYKDLCPSSLPNVMVDVNGCARILPPPPIPAMGVDIYYETGSALIKPQYKDDFIALSKYMQKYPSVELIAEGHTDSIGSESFNMDLSLQRAKKVKQELFISYGIEVDRINVVGKGEMQPKADNKTSAGRYLNRRVNVRTAPLNTNN